MKHFKGIIPILLLASILCGCNNTDDAPESTDAFVSDGSSQDTGTQSVNYSENTVSSDTTASDNAVSSEPTVSEVLPQRGPTESEQVLKLLSNYSDFIAKYTLPASDEAWDNVPFIDKTVSIKANYSYGTVTIIDSNQSDADYDTLYYKLRDEWTDIFDSLATENQKQQLVQETTYIVSYNGSLFRASDPGGRGSGLGMSYLVLNSMEKTDENTIVCKVTSVGDKDEWGLEEDWVESEVITIKRTDKGLRVDSCSLSAAEFFWRYREIRYGDITLSL